MRFFWNSDLSGILKLDQLLTIPKAWVGVRNTGTGKRGRSPRRTNAPHEVVVSAGLASGRMI
jgi:hypothetical protein